MPVCGHWHLRHRAEDYLERRALETDASEPGVHVLKAERAVDEWQRLEPPAIGHERPRLHEFFGRTRTCLASMDAERGVATALCWVSAEGEIGPAVGETPEDLVPVVLAALDRVAQVAGARVARRVLHDRLMVAARPAAPARLPRALAELGDVLGAAAGARPLHGHAPAAAPVSGALPDLELMGERVSQAATKLIAIAVLVVAAWILFKVVLGFVAAVAWVLVAVLAVVAVVWALRVL